MHYRYRYNKRILHVAVHWGGFKKRSGYFYGPVNWILFSIFTVVSKTHAQLSCDHFLIINMGYYNIMVSFSNSPA